MKIAVVGDIMIDVDLHCSCSRICQEGPWPVFSIERSERRLGGAGNVAQMVAALGARALLLGLVGSDDWSSIPEVHAEIGWRISGRQTTTKSRYWINGRLTGPRADFDNTHLSSESDIAHFLCSIKDFESDSIIVADHGKGVVTEDFLRRLAALQIPIYVDPIKSTSFPDTFHCAAIAGGPHELPVTPHHWAECVIEKHGPAGVAWSLSPQPSFLNHNSAFSRLPSACENLVDPLGAGDQFIAALAYQRGLGTDWPDAIIWANFAAGIQCERTGCVPVTANDIACHHALA